MRHWPELFCGVEVRTGADGLDVVEHLAHRHRRRGTSPFPSPEDEAQLHRAEYRSSEVLKGLVRQIARTVARLVDDVLATGAGSSAGRAAVLDRAVHIGCGNEVVGPNGFAPVGRHAHSLGEHERSSLRSVVLGTLDARHDGRRRFDVAAG